MGIPKFVEDLEKQADSLIEELKAKQEPGTPEDEQSQALGDESIEKKDVKSNEKNEGDTTLLEELNTWKHKYEVLQYKYNAEVPRMAEEIRLLKEEIAKLQQDVGSTQKTTAPVDTPETLEEFKMEYPEIYEAMEAMMSSKMKSIIEKYNAEIEKLKSELGSKVEVSINKTREAFISRMDKEIPNWREINVDPKFLEWLNVPDKYTGIPKLQLLRQAWDNLDFDRSVAFFKDYINEIGGNKKPPVFPAGSGNKTVTTDSNGEIITPQDITRISRRIQQLINEQKYDEANKLERKLDEALKRKITTV